jgi:subtilisin family serine protease
LIQAYDAWDVTKGDPGLVIAVSDNGIDYDHNDLQTNRFFNSADPVNGLDDDGNGYVDD